MTNIGLLVLMACFSVFALLTTIVVRRRAIAGVRGVTKSWADNVGYGMYSQMDRVGAINELQDAIHGSFWFALLRRLTGIAPLVGVMLSALAFWSAEGGAAGPDSAGGMEVLKSLRPAFSGVVVGATWAVINQIVVLRLEHWIQAQVAKAISDCDSDKIGSANAIPSRLVSDVEGFGRAVVACREAMMAVQVEFAEGSARQLKRYVAASDQLEASAIGAAKRLETASDSLFANMKEFTSEYAKAVRSMTKTVERLDAKITLYLTDAADANREAGDAIRQALSETQQVVSQLGSEMGRSLVALATSAEAELQSFRNVAIAASEESSNAIRAAAERMSGSVASSLSSLSVSLQAQHSSMGAALSESLQAVGRDMTGGLGQASAAASALADAASELARLRAGLQEPLRAIAGQSDRLAAAAEQLASLTADVARRSESSELRADAAATKFDDVSRRIVAWADQMRDDINARDARLEILDRRLISLGELLRAPSGSPVPHPEATPS